MFTLPRSKRTALYVGIFGLSAFLALRQTSRGPWTSLTPPMASAATSASDKNYSLIDMNVVSPVLRAVRERYVDPKRVHPREMFLSGLNFVQREVPQVIVSHEEGAAMATVRVGATEKTFDVQGILSLWDLGARVRDVFGFLQEGLKGSDVKLRELEYTMCNGMLHTLDPHSVVLSPEAFKEMNLTTRGHFGGLGIVISIRDQQLTVLNPMPGTPAGRAGLKKYDRIVKIDAESTLNMGLNEAVGHLRGDPGTKVTVWVVREGEGGWAEPKPFQLLREVIKVETTESRLLDGNIGYVRLKQFGANTSGDLAKALEGFRGKGELKGLVLDLRGNPGGLLDQAAKVVDKFVTSGPLVATVGNEAEGREQQDAKGPGTEPDYPLVVLVNGSSASASEIVAGSLKNHTRAVIVGDPSFGKGSVQMLFDNLPEGAALKLTTAQYLTEPGDVSIQGVGVTPDIKLDPMTVDPIEMDLMVEAPSLKEKDLSRSLSNTRARAGAEPTESLRFFLPEDERQAWRERGGDPDDNFTPDFYVKFARDLASKMPRTAKAEQLKAVHAFVQATSKQEMDKAAAALQKLGIDWSEPKTAGNLPALDVKVETDKPGNEVTAGDSINLKVTVTNKGTEPAYRLRAVTKSDNGYFDSKELVFGKVMPGQSATAIAPMGYCETEGYKPGSTIPRAKGAKRICKLPKDMLSRADWVRVLAEDGMKRKVPEARAELRVKPIDHPQFAFGYRVVQEGGFSDGTVRPGDHVTLRVSVKNTGKGVAADAQANLRNLSGDGLLLKQGRFDLSGLKPDETRELSFQFDVANQVPDNEAKVEFSVADKDTRASIVEKVRMPVVARKAGAAASNVAVVVDHMPPSIAIETPVTATRSDRIKISGRISSGAEVKDAYVYVGARKLSYQSNKGGSDPKAMQLSADLALRPGTNVITVVARGANDTMSRKTFVVRKDGPNGEFLETPKNDEELSETSGGGDDD